MVHLAHADEPIFNGVERVFGATNINAVSGHGRTAIGVSQYGELTVLTWPNPSYMDQLGYVTSNDVDARQQARYGASESARFRVWARAPIRPKYNRYFGRTIKLAFCIQNGKIHGVAHDWRSLTIALSNTPSEMI